MSSNDQLWIARGLNLLLARIADGEIQLQGATHWCFGFAHAGIVMLAGGGRSGSGRFLEVPKGACQKQRTLSSALAANTANYNSMQMTR